MMEVGRNLDALVAEKVMGFSDIRTVETLPADLNWVLHREDGSMIGGATHLPEYSTNIAAAWEVVEKMAERSEQQSNPFSGGDGFFFDGPQFKNSAQYLTAEGYPTGTTCWFVILGNRDWRKIVCADTAPLAICLAALKAVGVKL